ncbi:MAG: acyl-CoA thioesterase [Pseudomonadota bacterium]|jgi:acyl-CoA thioesterase-2
MHAPLADLLRLLRLERLELDLFRGQSRDIGREQVFGGQVLGQALSAAYATTEGRLVHSLHAYFLRRGDHTAPILYEVDRSRDGHSFSSRRVIAIQHGQQIFHLSASFQVPEPGMEHQDPMPADLPGPEGLPDLFDVPAAVRARLPAAALRFIDQPLPFEFRMVQPIDPLRPRCEPPRQEVWFRAPDRLPDDPLLHHVLLAYASDFSLIGTAMRPHGVTMLTPGMVVASIDHAMWFHRPVRVDDWLLYSMDSPSASGGRGLARARIFTRDGVLVASTAQEGLMRAAPSRGSAGPSDPAPA